MHKIVLTASALALSATFAVAQDAPADTSLTTGHLTAVDTDANGAVSESEFRAAMQKAHAALDKDADGVVTWAEAETALTREHFDALDADRTGTVTPAEMDAQAQTDFAAADQDKDGALN